MNWRRFNLLARVRTWTANIAAAVEALKSETAALQQAVGRRDELAGGFQAVLDKHGAAISAAELALLSLQEQVLESTEDTEEDGAASLLMQEEAEARRELSASLLEMLTQHEGLRAALEAAQVALTDLGAEQSSIRSDLGASDLAREDLAQLVVRLESAIMALKDSFAVANASAAENRATVSNLSIELTDAVGLVTSEQHSLRTAVEVAEAALRAALASECAARQHLTRGVEELAAQQGAVLEQLQAANSALSQLGADHHALSVSFREMAGEGAHLFRAMAQLSGGAGQLIATAQNLYISERGDSAIIIASLARQADAIFVSGDIPEIVRKLVEGKLTRLFVTADPPPAGRASIEAAEELIPLFREMPKFAAALFAKAQPAESAPDRNQFYASALSCLRINPNVVDSIAEFYARSFGERPAPFDKPAELPRALPAQPKRRSALFLHNNYYHFNILSEALRKRGWDTLTVSTTAPDSPQRQFFHGEDVNLFDDDSSRMREKVRAFFAMVPERFGALHFYGQGHGSFFPENFEMTPAHQQVPWDLAELRRHRVMIGYMPTGCLDGSRQSDIRRITGGLCAHCVWEHEPSVCSDRRGASWAAHLDAVCDWIGLEGDWVVGARTGAKYVRGPVVTTLDPAIWQPELRVAKGMKLARKPGEILVYHAVGNFESRKRAGRDIKGTGAVMKAIETLQSEGLPVQLIFFSDVPSTEIKNYQVQADIVVDQLHYGRYGANARECLMLGRPVVGHIDARQEGTEETLRMYDECPIVRADVDSVTDVLRGLVTDAAARERIGRASRDYAIRWHGAEACAERYERVIDRLRDGLAPDSPDLYPGLRVVDTTHIDQFAAESAASRSRRAPAE